MYKTAQQKPEQQADRFRVLMAGSPPSNHSQLAAGSAQSADSNIVPVTFGHTTTYDDWSSGRLVVC
jgi:hypothetical protein